MTQEEKLAHATALLRYFPGPCALMCSFGKDSMVLLHLIREVLPANEMLCGTYPVQIIYHRHPWFPAKNEFAEGVIKSWNLEVHEYPPLACGIKCKPDRFELVARYPFGASAMDLPINIEEPIARRDYACGLQWILRPKQTSMGWYWNTVFIGHKSSDVDPYDGAVPLKKDAAGIGNVNLVFPLRHWTDDDIWDYIEENHIPYDKRRYTTSLQGATKYSEVEDKWLNPDYLHACYRCIDPRNTDEKVLCPKMGEMIPNIGNRVLQLGSRPQYVEDLSSVALAKEEAA